MKCWICNHEAESGEHLVKASDIKGYFGDISQNKPIYFHNDEKRNVKIGSAKSKIFTSKALICKKCNNELSQPYDKAWEKLSSYLRDNWHIIKKSKKLNLSKIFPGEVRRQSINIQLFFVKLFGCRVAEHEIPINLSGFSASLINSESNKDIFLVFGETPVNLKAKKYICLTPVHCLDNKKESLGAIWIYTIGDVSIKVMYSPIVKKGNALGNAWHPFNKSKIMKLGKI